MSYQLWKIKPSQFPHQSSPQKQLTELVKYGHLAASAHNTQPWKFKLTQDSIQVHADETYWLTASDPTKKEMYTSVGCTIPNIEIAADYFGIKYQTSLLPNPKKPTHVATIKFTFPKTKSPTPKESLFPYITKRLTNRAKYIRSKPIPNPIFKEIQAAISDYPVELDFYTDDQVLSKLTQINKDGIHAALSIYEFRDELSRWVRHNWTKKGDGLPANTLGMPDAVSIMLPTLVRSPMMAKTTSIEEEKLLKSSPASAMFWAKENSINNWIQTGMAFTHVALICQKHKIAIEPLTASVEMPKQKKELLAYLKEKREPMMFFRLGYPKKAFPHSPRRTIDKVIAAN